MVGLWSRRFKPGPDTWPPTPCDTPAGIVAICLNSYNGTAGNLSQSDCPMVDYSRLRFLVVEDCTDFRAARIGMGRQMGANDIDAVGRGEEALALRRRNQYDVNLPHYNLGGGKNGQQVLEGLHHRRLLPPHGVFVRIS